MFERFGEQPEVKELTTEEAVELIRAGKVEKFIKRQEENGVNLGGGGIEEAKAELLKELVDKGNMNRALHVARALHGISAAGLLSNLPMDELTKVKIFEYRQEKSVKLTKRVLDTGPIGKLNKLASTTIGAYSKEEWEEQQADYRRDLEKEEKELESLRSRREDLEKSALEKENKETESQEKNVNKEEAPEEPKE